MMESFIKAKEASKRLGIGERTLKEMAREGKIPARRMGERSPWLFLESQLTEWQRQTEEGV